MSYKRQVCSVADCGRQRTYGDGLCSPHGRRKRKGIIPWDGPIRLQLKNIGNCSVAGCSNPSKKKTLCTSHYQRKAKGISRWDGALKPRRKNATPFHGRFWISRQAASYLKKSIEARGMSEYSFICELLELWVETSSRHQKETSFDLIRHEDFVRRGQEINA